MERIAPNELEKRIDEVLFYVWDPLGIGGEPYARAEYRSYVAEIMKVLDQCGSAEAIANALCEIEAQSMAVSPNKERALSSANLIVKHKESIDERCA